MNRAQNSSSLPHALCTRQFYRRKKPLFEIGSLLFDATRMPQARPSTYAITANLEPYRRQAQVYPSDRGLLLGLNHRRCHRCRLRVFFARFATLRQSPPIAKTKILTFLQLFSIRDSLPFPQSEKRPFCSFFTAFLGHNLRFFVTRQSAIEKSCILTRFFVSGPLEQFPDGTVGQLQYVRQNKKPGICLACMSEDDAPPCGPQILEMQRAPLRAPSPHKQPHSPARLPFGELRSPLAFTFPLLRAPQHVRTGATLLLPQARAVTC